MSSESTDLKPIINKQGQIILEDVPDLVLCKPRLIPLKSLNLEKLEKMQHAANEEKQKNENE